ncbi:MAG: hypothetical protein E7031_02425 [Akkermansiaceae bacterium]|nr:hypothetical protein [Akkermansiaceae bacterium]
MSEEKTEQAGTDAEAQYQVYLLEVGRKDADRHVAENMLGGEIGEVMRLVVTLGGAGLVALLFEGGAHGGCGLLVAAAICFLLAVLLMVGAYVVSIKSLMNRVEDLADLEKSRSEYREDFNRLQMTVMLHAVLALVAGLVCVFVEVCL